MRERERDSACFCKLVGVRVCVGDRVHLGVREKESVCSWRKREEGERVSGKIMLVSKQKKRVCGKELHFKLCVIQRERER